MEFFAPHGCFYGRNPYENARFGPEPASPGVELEKGRGEVRGLDGRRVEVGPEPLRVFGPQADAAPRTRPTCATGPLGGRSPRVRQGLESVGPEPPVEAGATDEKVREAQQSHGSKSAKHSHLKAKERSPSGRQELYRSQDNHLIILDNDSGNQQNVNGKHLAIKKGSQSLSKPWKGLIVANENNGNAADDMDGSSLTGDRIKFLRAGDSEE